MRITKILTGVFIFVAFIYACDDASQIDPANIYGEWKIDSVYSYQNGFDMMKRGNDNWPTYEYFNSGKISEKNYGVNKEFLFDIVSEDSMIYKNPDETLMGGYKILKLEKNELVLKKMITPIFKTTDKEIYEIFTILFLHQER